MTRSHRQNSIRLISDRPASITETQEAGAHREFAQDVFTDEVMKRLLQQKHEDLRKTIDEGVALNGATAEAVANDAFMGAELGATLHPLVPAHDGPHRREARFVLELNRVRRSSSRWWPTHQGEPDASSFPSGGIRQTFGGARLPLGPVKPCFYSSRPERVYAVYSDGILLVYRRSAR